MELGNSKYNFYVIAPFNSRMVFDYSTLIGKYEKIRKQLYTKVDRIYPNKVLIEKFKDEIQKEILFIMSDNTEKYQGLLNMIGVSDVKQLEGEK